MNNDDDRLMRCFASAFPNATRDEIRTAKFDAILWLGFTSRSNPISCSGRGIRGKIDLPELLELETFNSVKRYLSQRGMISKVNE